MNIALIRVIVADTRDADLKLAVEDVVTTTHGTITKIDKATKTLVVKTADGTEHVFHCTKDASVHGVKATDVAAKD